MRFSPLTREVSSASIRPDKLYSSDVCSVHLGPPKFEAIIISVRFVSCSYTWSRPKEQLMPQDHINLHELAATTVTSEVHVCNDVQCTIRSLVVTVDSWNMLVLCRHSVQVLSQVCSVLSTPL